MSDQQLIKTLNGLVTTRQRPALKALEPRGALPGRRVSVEYRERPNSNGGIASPLAEKTKTVEGQPVADGREYHPAQVLESSDGIFSLVLKPLKKVLMVDADGIEHVFEYAMPADDEGA